MSEVLFWCYLSNTLLSAVTMLIVEGPVLPRNYYDALLVTVHSLSYAIIWPLYMLSIKYISGNTFAFLASSIIVLMLLAQYTVLSSILPGHRNLMEIIGVVLVLVGSTLGSIAELCRPNQKSKNSEK